MPALQRNADPQVGATAGPAAGPRTQRRSFGRFPTGVTVVSYRDGDQMRGATVNSFTSVSLDPPLLLVALARSSRACAALAAIPFAVNVLRSDQLYSLDGPPSPGWVGSAQRIHALLEQ